MELATLAFAAACDGQVPASADWFQDIDRLRAEHKVSPMTDEEKLAFLLEERPPGLVFVATRWMDERATHEGMQVALVQFRKKKNGRWTNRTVWCAKKTVFHQTPFDEIQWLSKRLYLPFCAGTLHSGSGVSPEELRVLMDLVRPLP